jgi:mitochondrial fission protein ELM1
VAGASEPLVVWLLTDGAAGHESQSQGIVDALAEGRALRVERVSLKLRGGSRKRLARLALKLRLPLSARWLARLYDGLRLPDGRPGLIVSSGGNTLAASAILARAHGVPNVYSGTPKGWPAHACDVVFTVVPAGTANNVVLALPPVPQAAVDVAATAPGDCLLLLIGGATAEYPFSDGDFRALVEGMVCLARQTGRRWLVTTSRRSGERVEDLLATQLPADIVADMVLFGRAPRRVMGEFLRRAAQVYVTEDSLSMVAEAIWSGRPACSIAPVQAAPGRNDRLALESYAAQGLLRRVTVPQFAAGDHPPLPAAAPALPPVRAQIRQVVETLLTKGEQRA